MIIPFRSCPSSFPRQVSVLLQKTYSNPPLLGLVRSSTHPSSFITRVNLPNSGRSLTSSDESKRDTTNTSFRASIGSSLSCNMLKYVRALRRNSSLSLTISIGLSWNIFELSVEDELNAGSGTAIFPRTFCGADGVVALPPFCAGTLLLCLRDNSAGAVPEIRRVTSRLCIGTTIVTR